jgi:hypothetical protein
MQHFVREREVDRSGRLPVDASSATAVPPSHGVRVGLLLALQQSAGNYVTQRLLRNARARVILPPAERVLIQRAPPVASAGTVMPPAWLGPLRSTAVHVKGNIWSVKIASLGGDTWVGPYLELSAFIRQQGFAGQLQAAHVVGGEHLLDLGSPHTYDKAPCVAVTTEVHAGWTSKTTFLQTKWLGGRQTRTHERVLPRRPEVRGIYNELYSDRPEIRRMAIDIIDEAVTPASNEGAKPGTGSIPLLGPAEGPPAVKSSAGASTRTGRAAAAVKQFGRFGGATARSAAVAGIFVGLDYLRGLLDQELIEKQLNDLQPYETELLRASLPQGIVLALRELDEAVYATVIYRITWTSTAKTEVDPPVRDFPVVAREDVRVEFGLEPKQGKQAQGRETPGVLVIDWVDLCHSLLLEALLEEFWPEGLEVIAKERGKHERLERPRLSNVSLVPHEDPLRRYGR